MPHDRCHLWFAVGAIAAFLFATLVADVVAGMLVSQESLGRAAWRHRELFYSSVPMLLLGTSQAFLPFAVLAWIATSLTQRRSPLTGLLLYLLGMGALITLYFVGYFQAQHYIQQGMWRVGMRVLVSLPYQSVYVLAGCGLVIWLLTYLAEKGRGHNPPG